MGIKFFWRFESTTLDPTDDFSAGDTTAAASGTPSLGAAGARIGTNGQITDTGGDQYRFDPTTGIMTAPKVGAFGLSYRMPTNIPTGGTTIMILRGSGGAGVNICELRMAGSGPVGCIDLHIGSGAGVAVDLTTTMPMEIGRWYGVIGRWDEVNHRRSVELYNQFDGLLQKIEDLTTVFAAPSDFTLATGLRYGRDGAEVFNTHYDNAFISDYYDEPIQNNFQIASYTNYNPALTFGSQLVGQVLT